jgi:hypothetical protein
MQPTIGRIVIYQLTQEDATAINRRRTTPESIKGRMSEGWHPRWPEGAQAHIGNYATVGDECPAMIVRCPRQDRWVNLQVFLDGNDVLWVTGVQEGSINGQWHWSETQWDAIKSALPPQTHGGGPPTGGEPEKWPTLRTPGCF